MYYFIHYAIILVLVSACLWPMVSHAQYHSPVALAKLYQANENLSQYLVSEKYDGVRAFWTGKELLSRSGRKIAAPSTWLKQLPPTPLDGELWISHHNFDKISGITRKKSPIESEWHEVKFMAFDLPTYDGNFIERHFQLKEVLNTGHYPVVTLVQQDAVKDHQALNELLAEKVDRGAEGLMLRKIHAPYRAGRSQDLLKIKPYMDAEATVIGIQSGQGKYAGQMGALEVINGEGRVFEIGSGFSDKERANPPKVGDIITFKHHGFTSTGLPRFASFLRIRKDQFN